MRGTTLPYAFTEFIRKIENFTTSSALIIGAVGGAVG
jgi:hypothetical protein